MNLNKSSIWKIESFRATNFIVGEFNSKSLENWLVEIGKQEPTQVTKTGTRFAGLSKLESSILKLEWKQNRIDLIQSADTPNVENNIGNFDLFKIYCENIILKLFEMESFPSCNRLALGVTLHFPVANNKEGIEKIKPFLKSVVGLEDTEDFQLRLNRPKIYNIDGEIKINRLLTWTIGYVQLLQIELNTGIAQNISSSDKPELLCRLEMDISTDQNPEIIMSIERQKKVMNTLIDIANQVAESGESTL